MEILTSSSCEEEKAADPAAEEVLVAPLEVLEEDLDLATLGTGCIGP
jgi:hypothetical protein